MTFIGYKEKTGKPNLYIDCIKNTGTRIQGHRDTWVKEYRGSRIQGYKDSRIHGYKGTRIQGYKGSGIQGYRVHEYGNTKI